MHNPDNPAGPSGVDPFLLAYCFLCLSIFPTLLADFKDPIQNWDKVPDLKAKFHITHAPSNLLP